jgi:tetratricopeptide (TPR) repeat protein
MKRLATLLGFALLLGTGSLAGAAEPAAGGASILDDPEWRKHFLGTYGVLSGAEPPITEQEREILPEIIELMETNPEAAAERLEQAVGAGSSASLDFILANLHFQSGAQEPAMENYRRALEKFPDFRRAHKNLGLLLVQRSEFKEAVEHLSHAIELGDRDGRNFGLLGHAYVNLEDYVAAETAYRNAILQQPGTKDWKLGLARSLLAMEKYQEAVALFDTLIAANPEDATSWMLQANAYLGLEKPLEAAVNLEAVRMLGKTQKSSLVLLGDIYMNAGMPDLARSAYMEVIDKDASAVDYPTAYRAADLLIRARSPKDAAEVLASIDKRYGKALTSSQRLDVLTLKAKVARAQGRDGDAAKLLESIVKEDGTRGAALLELAAYYRSKNDPERALLMLERAEKLSEFEYAALLGRAQLLVASKDYAKAASVLKQALQIKSEPRVERFLASVEQAIPQ